MNDNANPFGELVGYADQNSVAPGDRIRFMVSTNTADYEAQIVRLIHGDNNPAGPGYKEEEIDTSVSGRYPGRTQVIHNGSYVRIDDSAKLNLNGSVTLAAWILPTTPTVGRVQGLLGSWSAEQGGYGLVLDTDGSLGFRAGSGPVVSTGVPLHRRQWYFVAASYDAGAGTVRLSHQMRDPWPLDDASAAVDRDVAGGTGNGGAPFILGAGALATDARGKVHGADLYNGKIDSPRVFSQALGGDALISVKDGGAANDSLVAAWDFSIGINTHRVTDTSGNGLNGETIQTPARAVTGYNWDGSELNHVYAPQQYGAIHFHDTDLEDAGWDVDFELTIPDGLKSGVYAARLRSEGQEDYIPFTVRRPRSGAGSGAKIAFQLPTLTYLAYANDQLLFNSDIVEGIATNVTPDPSDYFLKVHPEMGLSMYDSHSDGSGVMYSTRLRPIVSTRPKYRQWLVQAPRHFSADLYLIDWLEAKGLEYDVFTDDDVHHDGVDLYSHYKVVITGSHPEYWTTPMRDALDAYQEQGGSFMYLGGNGLYWVTAIDPERPYLGELRRGDGGIRTWESWPGELYNSTTGELGGLWRYRGRAPNVSTGIGFATQGFDKASHWVRQPGSFDPRAAWIFEGVGADELIGNFGLVMGGVVGDELDRVDFDLGSPPHTLVLATSEGLHSDAYLLVVEDIPLTIPNIGGSNNKLVRSDMTYLEGPNGGHIFSVGSIANMGSLSHNNYQNNYSRIIENVIRRCIG